MRAPIWASATSFPLASLIFSWIDGTIAEPSSPICLTRNWRDVEAGFIQWPICVETRWDSSAATPAADPLSVTVSEASTTPTTTATTTTAPSPSDDRPDADSDTDSLLDNANFLSFEDWKKQNLAKVGQSAENVGGSRRAGAAGKEDRRRPTGINNALDSLGEDVEIELDFGGFGADTADPAKPTAWGAQVPVETKGAGGDARAGGEGGTPAGDEPPAQGVARRGKDAGTTCKERFNYASFDCAATVLKTNPECKGSSSVLIENKDSYMLNECRAKNKFLILELCDDILVDTVVLANYEFFSSIFHTFRVSVSDRYPAKPDQWRELGVYEARNTREVQAFAVSNPLIWARYLRIEFLTHYGNEFYCPVSLIRVHGTTMLEEYKHDGEAGRGDDEVSEASHEEVNPSAGRLDEKESQPPATGGSVESDSVDGAIAGHQTENICPNPGAEVEARLWGALAPLGMCSVHDRAVHIAAGDAAAQAAAEVLESTPHTKESPAIADAPSKAPADEQKVTVPAGGNADSSPPAAHTTTVAETATHNATVEADSKPNVSKEEQMTPPEATRPTGTQPPSPNPTTQESFFKSVNKRLQMLESNSTLSLLYIEEQSRILRDAFNKVEKRQLAKTSTFLEGLNGTVLNELKQLREQYDQVWKSVALEFEHQRIQYHQEIYSISAQLGVLADELVFQKRVSVIQSIMVLFCFALVLFSRGTVSSYIDFPSVQNMVARSYSLRSSSPPFGSPSVSPSSTRPASSYRGGTTAEAGHRRNISEDSQDASPLSPTIAYSPPTPTSDDAASPVEAEKDDSALSMPEVTPSHLRSRSSPPVMDGGREAEEGSEESEESEGEGDAGVELR